MARAYKRKVDARGYKNNNKENLEKAIEVTHFRFCLQVLLLGRGCYAAMTVESV